MLGEKAAADDKNDKKKPPHCPLCNSAVMILMNTEISMKWK